MPEARTERTLDLDRLSLVPGGGKRLDVAVNPGSIKLGGTDYAGPSEPVEARLDVSRTASGYAFRLRFATDLAGPCVSCLEPASRRIEVDSREVHQPGSGDDELESPYVEDEHLLRVADWARDALVLATPTRFLCRDDCRGLCPVCGESLNDVDPAEHQHEAPPDPRWAKLRELEIETGDG
jgi:uncharacterized protein